MTEDEISNLSIGEREVRESKFGAGRMSAWCFNYPVLGLPDYMRAWIEEGEHQEHWRFLFTPTGGGPYNDGELVSTKDAALNSLRDYLRKRFS